MSNRKFTDDEIIKALECCNTPGFCDKCPYYDEDADDYEEACKYFLIEDVFSLVQRQKAEIERLQAVHADMTESLRLAAEANKDMSVELDAMRGAANSYKMHYEKAKSEAIKEFADRLIKKCDAPHWCVWMSEIEDLKEEMTEGNNESQNT